jgi:hypothetical protein
MAQAIAIINDQHTQHEIARHYGVARSLISQIKSGKKWKHLAVRSEV